MVGVHEVDVKAETQSVPTRTSDATLRGLMRSITRTPEGIVTEGRDEAEGLLALCGTEPDTMFTIFTASLERFKSEGDAACHASGPVLDLAIHCPDLVLSWPFEMRLDAARRARQCQVLSGRGHGIPDVRVERSAVLRGSRLILLDGPAEVLLRRFRVIFEGEHARDTGGVFKEWVRILSHSFLHDLTDWFAERDGFIQVSKDGGLFLRHYEALGSLLAIAFQKGIQTPFRFPLVYYAKLLDQELKLGDIKKEDPQLFRTYMHLVEMDLDHTTEEGKDMYPIIFTEKDVEITESATEDNKVELILKKINSLTPGTARQFAQLKAGFNRLLPAEFLGPRITAHDLKAAMFSDVPISVTDLEAHMKVLKPLTPTSPLVERFWRVVRTFNDEELRELLVYVTATENAPLGGFAKLNPPFTIRLVGEDLETFEDKRLPTAHTCFNVIDLPNYPDEDTMRAKLLYAIKADPAMGET